MDLWTCKEKLRQFDKDYLEEKKLNGKGILEQATSNDLYS